MSTKDGAKDGECSFDDVVTVGVDPSWKPMVVGTSSDDGEEKQGRELEQDVYTLFFLSHPFSEPFLYSAVVIIFQYFVYGLILVDMLLQNKEDPYRDKDNWLSVPVYVGTAVRIAQYTAALIAIVSQEDLITTINLISVGYDSSLLETFPSATNAYWMVSCSLRFLEGVISVFVAFVFIVQSTRVLDLYMNFAAVEFVAHLDNIAFRMADMGFVGQVTQKAAKEAKEVHMPLHDERRRLRHIAVVVSVALTVGSLFFIQRRQQNGTYLKGASCQKLQISFPEEFLQLETTIDFSGTARDKSFFTMNFFPTGENDTPPPLVYAYFSGEYVAADNILIENRLVYYERDWPDVTSGMFYYCEQEKAWVFTIRAIHKSDLPESDCRHGWLMKSQRTEAMKLQDVGNDGWQVWTGSSTAADLSMICNQCYIKSDCGGHGNCTGKSCSCNSDRAGKHCEFETPFCPRLKLTILGDNALSFRPGPKYDLVVNNDGDGETTRLLYNRPFFQNANNTIFYSGTRWLNVDTSEGDFDEIETILEFGEDDINHFHAYWHLDVLRTLLEYSDPTDSDTPIGANWNLLDLNAAVGESPPYGIAFPIKQQYVCGRCLNITNYCGARGQCDDETTGGYCACDATLGVGGDYCEFTPFCPYVLPLVQEFLVFSIIYNNASFDRSWYPYAERYWNDLNDDELSDLLRGPL